MVFPGDHNKFEKKDLWKVPLGITIFVLYYMIIFFASAMPYYFLHQCNILVPMILVLPVVFAIMGLIIYYLAKYEFSCEDVMSYLD